MKKTTEQHLANASIALKEGDGKSLVASLKEAGIFKEVKVCSINISKEERMALSSIVVYMGDVDEDFWNNCQCNEDVKKEIDIDKCKCKENENHILRDVMIVAALYGRIAESEIKPELGRNFSKEYFEENGFTEVV